MSSNHAYYCGCGCKDTITLAELEQSARAMGYGAEVIGTGGNVLALSLTVDGAHALVSLGEGVSEGEDWSVGLDGDTRETYGDRDSGPHPVTSDAGQTIAEAAAWITARTTDGDLSLCVDCTLMAANGEATESPDSEPLSLLTGLVVLTGGRNDFHTTPCDGCGSTLAGSRHAATVLDLP